MARRFVPGGRALRPRVSSLGSGIAILRCYRNKRQLSRGRAGPETPPRRPRPRIGFGRLRNRRRLVLFYRLAERQNPGESIKIAAGVVGGLPDGRG